MALPTILVAMGLAGCRTPSPTVTLHTLSPLAAPGQAKSTMALEIMPVQLPELLQRSPIVLQTGTGTHRLSETHRWGNLLERDMQRVLAENLSSRLGTPSVVLYPQGETVKAAYRISLEVSRMDGAPGGTLAFRGAWMLQKTGTNQLVTLHKVVLDEPVGSQGIQDLVAAHDRILEKLSQEIAAEVRSLNP